MAFVKAREILGKTLTLVDVDYREGNYGPEVVWELVDEEGNEQTLTQARTQGRERVALAVCYALEASPDGVPFTLIEVPLKNGKTFFAVKEFNVSGGRGSSALRAQYRSTRGITGSTATQDIEF